jgi:dienelactone hydrolase
MAGLARGQSGKTELHSFDTKTLTDQQFLTGSKDGESVRIAGELRLPPGNGRLPAVVLVHGSGGIGANVNQWAEELNKIGVATFVLDSFTGRGIVQTITNQAQLGNLAMIVDAYKALELLSKDARIDSSRIARMDFSKGGFVALYASLKRFQRMYGPTNVEFAAYIPFYAPCYPTFIDDNNVSDRPIRLFHGASDDYVPVAPCREYVARLRKAGKDVQLTEFAGAFHTFDNPLNLPVPSLPNAEVTYHCRREERPGGEIINLETGRPFTLNDSCVTRGATVGYDAKAREDAVKAIKDFLRSLWKLSQYHPILNAHQLSSRENSLSMETVRLNGSKRGIPRDR